MVDTSIIERKIYSNVMDTCFNAIVVEAFVNSVPIDGSEMTDELRDSLSHYAAECLTDLGSSRLLTEALESVKNHTSRLSAPEVAYLKQINSICMETAQGVTARIIEENKGNDDALKTAADKVALTKSEFERFSKAAANVTPDALSKMIQNKTLDTIKEEKEAFQKDKELELEIVNAINAVSDEEDPDEIPPEMGDVGTSPKTGADIGQNAAPGNEEPQSEEPVGESWLIPVSSMAAGKLEPGNEGILDRVFKKGGGFGSASAQAKESESNENLVESYIKDNAIAQAASTAMKELNQVYPKHEGNRQRITDDIARIGFAYRNDVAAIYVKDVPGFGGNCFIIFKNSSIATEKSPRVMAFTRAMFMRDCDNGVFGKDHPIAYSYTAKMINNGRDIRIYMRHKYPNHLKRDLYDHWVRDPQTVMTDEPGTKDAVESYGFSTRKAMESYVGVQKKVSEDAMDAFMKSVAGQNYRRKHSSIFSRLQELAYEGILATTESYDSIPFGTMAAITKENTFSQFNSHRSKDLKATMESVSRYDFESIGTPDGPTKEQLSNGLLVASIIYTFFETLNSMNLFCPKLNEIRAFVDETIPIKDRVALDQKQFMDFFRSVIANAKKQLQGVSTVPDVDVIQKDLDVVREHTAAPGFDDDRHEINEAIESLQAAIDAKRDAIIKTTTQSVTKVDESAYESMMRTTDTLKFTRVANIAGRKPNVASFRCKIDPSSKYICMEALNASGVPVGRNSFALESRIPRDGLVDFVTTAVKSSKLMTCGKRVVVSDKRNGKIYLDTTKL